MKLSSNAQSVYRIQDYAGQPDIEGVTLVELRRFADDGGSLVELMRITERGIKGLDGFHLAQVNHSGLQPGAVKAFHVHLRQTDLWFVRPEDRVLLVLVDVRSGSATEGKISRSVLGDGNSALVRIPPGVAHGCRNLGSTAASILYFTDREFSSDADACDEGRLPWDFAGKEIWDVAWE